MLDSRDFRECTITVYGADNVITQYTGKHYIFYGDAVNDNCFHFVDEEYRHHRIYGGTVIVDEL